MPRSIHISGYQFEIRRSATTLDRSQRDDLSSTRHCGVEPVQLEGERDVDDPGENRISADHPDQSQSAGPGPDYKDGTEQDRQHAAQDQQPFIVNLFAQPDGDDLEHAGGDRPAGNEGEENDPVMPGHRNVKTPAATPSKAPRTVPAPASAESQTAPRCPQPWQIAIPRPLFEGNSHQAGSCNPGVLPLFEPRPRTAVKVMLSPLYGGPWHLPGAHLPQFVTYGVRASQTNVRGRMTDRQGPVSCVSSKDGSLHSLSQNKPSQLLPRHSKCQPLYGRPPRRPDAQPGFKHSDNRRNRDAGCPPS
jgi:hypothetical protein